MLLRRFYTQVKNQDWAAATIELSIVVVGIFLGLQASNWNDDRVERNLERGYLIRLQEDILASARGQERDIRHLEQQLADQAIILAALDECQIPPDDALAIQRGIGSLGLVNAPRLFRRTIDDLAATGRMDIIRNEEIKAELAAIVAEVEFRDRVMESVFRHVEHHRHFIEDQVRYDVSRPIDGPACGEGVHRPRPGTRGTRLLQTRCPGFWRPICHGCGGPHVPDSESASDAYAHNVWRPRCSGLEIHRL